MGEGQSLVQQRQDEDRAHLGAQDRCCCRSLELSHRWPSDRSVGCRKLVRIQWWKFTVAQIPGAMAWATIYSGVGLAGWKAAIAVFTGDGILPAIALVVLVAAAIVGVVFISKSIRKSSAAKNNGGAPAASPAEDTVPGSESAAEAGTKTESAAGTEGHVETRH